MLHYGKVKVKFIPRGLPREPTGDGDSKGEPRAPLWSPSVRTCFAQAKYIRINTAGLAPRIFNKKSINSTPVLPVLHLERGMVLILALLFLALMSSLIIVAMRNSQLELKMTQHYQERLQAFLAAENALNEAKKSLQNNEKITEGKTTNGVFQIELLSENDCERNYLLKSTGQMLQANVHIVAEYQQSYPSCGGYTKQLWWHIF